MSEQLEIPGTATEREKLLEAQIDDYIGCRKREANAKNKKVDHAENIFSLLKAMKMKTVKRGGFQFKLDAREKLYVEKEAGEKEASEDSDENEE